MAHAEPPSLSYVCLRVLLMSLARNICGSTFRPEEQMEPVVSLQPSSSLTVLIVVPLMDFVATRRCLSFS